MSSRDHRRRERSWEREDRDRGDKYSRGGRSGYRDEPRRRSSRSRSPRRGDRERRDHRDYRSRDDRKERDSRRPDDLREKDRSRERERDRERDRDKERHRRDDEKETSRREVPPVKESIHSESDTTSRPDSELFSNNAEAGEAAEDDDAPMMALMGMAGFGSTKGKHVEGNQEGTVNIKKTRTWRQYMNRRGGFNRPLDKIK
ncbi:hypothetical protein J3R30DRAFT_883582 [Lentinula aciculospora]|uniref:U4/U6.U5 small nuclear ribonucleoprotein 27kDa protein domain-containing protein n=1 Tax=Lentinula aciculospora TaxID=153920 RepID=A0A9W9DVJ5_9AGAR|nr:hypothetical protein J3R30DRAFT_883582 [Lentinula aciculospora]